MTVELYDPTKAAAAPSGNLTYRGGPLLTSVQIVALYMQDFPYMAEMNTFLTYLVGSDVMDNLAEYSVPGQSIGHGAFLGSQVVLHTSVPAAASRRHRRPHKPASRTLDDAHIRALIGSLLTSGAIPAPDEETLYILYPDPGTTVTDGTDASCQVFCGYHDSFAYGTHGVYYAVLPYPNCQGCLGPHATFEALTGTTTHEVCEAITDPVPGSGWYDEQNGEIGDICAWNFRTSSVFSVQTEWSNAKHACI